MPEVRQSSFALLGDLTKACFQHVKPCIGKCSHSVVILSTIPLLFFSVYNVHVLLTCKINNTFLELFTT